jgi:2-polyprenyl-6-methoxyphenol hydroxylase-like FAD-dependent oxidoreductase
MAIGHALGELAPDTSPRPDACTAPAVRRVVVVGAGITGLACALACARAGALVDVLEARAGACRAPAHIDLVPNLLRELAQLGVGQACVQRGFAYTGISVLDEHGDEAFRLPTPHLAGRQLPPAAGIAHDALLDVLCDAAKQAGATLHHGMPVRAVDARQGRVTAGTGRVFEADLVLLAAGAESPLVSAVFGAAQPAGTQHTWWHTLLPRPAWLDRSTWMAGSVGRRLFLVPVGMTHAGLAVVTDAAAQGPADAGALRHLLDGWGALPRRIAAAIDAASPTTLRRVASSVREAPWWRGAVLCVGAAAHAIAPPFGQSAAQALEDAVVLGELLGRAPARAQLLRQFGERRTARVHELHALVEQGARWFARPEPGTDLMDLGRRIDAIVARPA